MKVVVVGGGYGGTEVIRQLVLRGTKNLETTLVSNRRYFENIIGGTEIISEKIQASDLRYDLGELSKYWDFSLIVGRANRFDLLRKAIAVGNRQEDYDVLVVAVGSEPNFPNVKGANLAHPSYRLSDFSRLNGWIRKNADGTSKIIVAGAGFVGLEVVAEILDLLRGMGNGADITVVEKMNTVLPAYNSDLAREIAFKTFSSRGVKFVLGNGVKSVETGRAVLDDGTKIETDLTVWTAGIKGCLSYSQVPRGSLRRGCIDVDERLLIKGVTGAFAIGDAANVVINGKEAAKMAAEALVQARTTAKNIELIAQARKPRISHMPNYTTDFPKALMSIGGGKAMLIFGTQFVSTGVTEYSLKKRIDVDEIMGRFPQ